MQAAQRVRTGNGCSPPTFGIALLLGATTPSVFVLSNGNFTIPVAFGAIEGNLSEKMAPEQEAKFEPETPGQVQAPSPQPVRRGRRSGRGHRGRRGRPHPQHKQPTPHQEQQRESPAPSPETAAKPLETGPPPERKSPSPAESESRAASNGGVQKAIEEVNNIITTLKESLDEMEEVLETLELAERQKDFDEREIESLRRALRHLQHPRDRTRSES